MSFTIGGCYEWELRGPAPAPHTPLAYAYSFAFTPHNSQAVPLPTLLSLLGLRGGSTAAGRSLAHLSVTDEAAAVGRPALTA